MENKKQYFTCSRWRMMDYLTKQGFAWESTIADIHKQGFINWVYEATPELKDTIRYYFEEVLKVEYKDVF